MNIITRIDNSVTTSLNHWGLHHVGLVKFLSDQLVFVVMVVAVALVVVDVYRAVRSDFGVWDFVERLFVAGLRVLVVPVGVATIISEVISLVYVRQRPFVGLHGIKLLSPHGADGGMPSHHMVFMIAIVVMVAGYNRLVFGGLLILTLISGLARVSAGIHYPSDIVAGLALGWVVAWVYQRVLDRVG